MATYYDDYLFTQTQSQSSSKYFGLSIFIHIALAIGALTLSIPVIEKLKQENITIEVIEPEHRPAPEIKQVATLEKSSANKNSRIESALNRLQSEVSDKDAVIAAPQPKSLAKAKLDTAIKAPLAKSKTSLAEKPKAITHTSKGSAEKAFSAPSRAGVPESLEDIAAPQLETDSVEVSQIGALGDDAFENEFANVDRSSAAALRAEKSALDNQAQQIADDADEKMKALEDSNAAEAQAMSESLEATRTKNAAQLEKIRAGERAAAEKAAREKTELAAKMAAAAKASAVKGAGAGQGSGEGIRSVAELRQMPGNPKPHYSVEERLQKQQGQVIFHAFVTPEGRLESIKLIRSSGYANLDQKSFDVLRKWKFYPGQQGWVEIPHVWNLKGDVEQVPTLLRRKVGLR